MALKDVMQAAVKSLHQAGDSLFEDVVYHEMQGTGSNLTDVPHNLRGLYFSFSEAEVDGDVIQPTDRRLQLDASLVSFTPHPADYVIDAAGTREEVVSVKHVPGDTVVYLQMRRAG